jgi:hypothetical protein
MNFDGIFREEANDKENNVQQKMTKKSGRGEHLQQSASGNCV